MMKKIQIHEDKNCAWCEVNGRFIYGKNVEEVRHWLDENVKKEE